MRVTEWEIKRESEKENTQKVTGYFLETMKETRWVVSRLNRISYIATIELRRGSKALKSTNKK